MSSTSTISSSWVLRVSRSSAQDTADVLARSVALRFPNIEFKIYAPFITMKRKLKNGSYSIKPKALFTGCLFVRCHDFIREYYGVGGFVGSKVGNTKRQINKPRPVSVEDMEAIFIQAREEQEKIDQALNENQCGEGTINPEKPIDSKPKSVSKNARNLSTGWADKQLVKGSTVKVLSGTSAGFVGSLQKLERRKGKAIVRFTLLWEEDLGRPWQT